MYAEREKNDHNSIIHDSQNKPPVEEWINKLRHIYTMI